jgi:hypothetical protein
MCRAVANRKWCELQPLFVEGKGIVQRAEKTAEVGIFGAFFFASFLLGKQKK